MAEEDSTPKSKSAPAQFRTLTDRFDNNYISIKKRFEELKEKSAKPWDPGQHKDKTRSGIAKIFVWGYFISMGVTFIAVLAYNLYIVHNFLPVELLDIRDILTTVTSGIGAPLGFVVGYYFKGEEKN